MKLGERLKSWCVDGMYFPFSHDPTTGKPSVTLMFFYISYMIGALITLVSSIMMIIKGDYLSATIAPGVLTGMGFVFYRMRHLDKVKIDLDDRALELWSDEEKEEKE